jgi:hypothetical protein
MTDLISYRCGIALDDVLFSFLYLNVELLMGIEPMTSSLPRKCSTPELQELFSTLSTKK